MWKYVRATKTQRLVRWNNGGRRLFSKVNPWFIANMSAYSRPYSGHEFTEIPKWKMKYSLCCYIYVVLFVMLTFYRSDLLRNKMNFWHSVIHIFDIWHSQLLLWRPQMCLLHIKCSHSDYILLNLLKLCLYTFFLFKSDAKSFYSFVSTIKIRPIAHVAF